MRDETFRIKAEACRLVLALLYSHWHEEIYTQALCYESNCIFVVLIFTLGQTPTICICDFTRL